MPSRPTWVEAPLGSSHSVGCRGGERADCAAKIGAGPLQEQLVLIGTRLVAGWGRAERGARSSS